MATYIEMSTNGKKIGETINEHQKRQLIYLYDLLRELVIRDMKVKYK